MIASTIDARLFALNAETGQPCLNFGAQGVVDLKVGMGEVKPDSYFQTAAPLIARDLIIIGGLVRDWRYQDMPSGVIRAFSTQTGKPGVGLGFGNPALTGLPSEGQSYTRGTPNMWSMASYDDKLGLVYVPLGVATGADDFWGACAARKMSGRQRYGRGAGKHRQGRPRWHFQAVHHDLWDYTCRRSRPCSTCRMRGGTIPALIQATKSGQIFLLRPARWNAHRAGGGETRSPRR